LTRAAALVLVGLATAGAVTPPEQAPRHRYSLIAATWPSGVVEPPCDPGMMCDVFVTNVPFADVETLAGPPVPRAAIFFLGWHGMLPPGEHFLAAAWREKGRWRAQRAGDFDQNNCVSADTLSYYRIPVPPRTSKKDDRICFHG
jgi:hypothetical protein